MAEYVMIGTQRVLIPPHLEGEVRERFCRGEPLTKAELTPPDPAPVAAPSTIDEE